MAIQNANNIRIIREFSRVPIILDAGVGTASDATIAMELGVDGVLMNTAIAEAQDPIAMATSMKLAVQAGRLAYRAGRMPKRMYASASSPLAGTIAERRRRGMFASFCADEIGRCLPRACTGILLGVSSRQLLLLRSPVMHDALGRALADQRMKAVLPHISGRLLDLGCGCNALVRLYANGVGVDVHPWPGADVIVDDSAALTWESQSFDTITIIAALNHMPNRKAVLQECRRVLRPDGRVVVTMLTPRTSQIWHWLRAPWDADQRERGMKPGEVYGITPADVVALFASCGFTLSSVSRFMFGFNRLYVFRLADTDAPAALGTRKKAS